MAEVGCTAFWYREVSGSVKFPARCGLICLDSPGRDVGAEVIFAAHRISEHATEIVDLADMRQRVGDCALEDLSWRVTQRFIRRQIHIEIAHRCEQAGGIVVPGSRR